MEFDTYFQPMRQYMPTPYYDEIETQIYDNGHRQFFLFKQKLTGSSHYSKLYQCLYCKKYFISKTGASQHICNRHAICSRAYQPGNKDSHKFIIHHLLRFIAVHNIPFYAIEDENLSKSYQILDNTFDIPGKDKLKLLMLEIADEIKKSFLRELSGQKVSLMIDGCQRWAKNYIGFIIFTPKRLYLYSVFNVPDEQSSTLAGLIANVVRELSLNNITVIAINTDNAANNRKALNGGDYSAQELSHFNFIRQPCAAHTLNLAIEDTFYNNNSRYHYIFEEIQYLLHHAPKKHNQKGNPIKLQTIRWSSLYECVCFIIDNKFYYQCSRDIPSRISYLRVEKNVTWECVKDILAIFIQFLYNIENDLCTIADIIEQFLSAIEKLGELQGDLAAYALDNLKNRFTTTCPLQLSWAAFLLTANGLSFFRNLNDADRPNIYQNARIGLENYMIQRNFNASLRILCGNYFDSYLITANEDCFDQFYSPYDFWKSSMEVPIFFKEVATEILSIPSTETACERLFSALSNLTSTKMSNLKPETVNARLMVKFNTIFEKTGKITVKDIHSNGISALNENYPNLHDVYQRNK